MSEDMNRLTRFIATRPGRSRLAVGWRTIRKRHIKMYPTCKACGYLPPKGSNDVHHIIPRHVDADRITDPANLVTLCRKYNCHLRFGHFGNYRKYWHRIIKKTLGMVGLCTRMEEIQHKLDKEMDNAS